MVELSCPEESVELVRSALAACQSVHLPITHKVNVQHGGYGRYTRYNITQHQYAGGGHPGCGGFIEALEIHDAPDDRCQFILHEDIEDYYRFGSVFFEFDSLANMLAIWDKAWGSGSQRRQNIESAPGFRRRVECGGLTPWFYAIGEQALWGDFAFPNHVGNDPVFRPLQKFVVYDSDEYPTIKTCMGCHTATREVPDYGRWGTAKKQQFRVVYWDDGTIYDEQNHSFLKRPRPLTERDLFAQQAVDRLRQCLSGKEKKFDIPLSDGGKFTCRFHPPDRSKHTAAGVYFARVTMINGEEKDGTFEFKPTPQCPTAEDFLAQQKRVKAVHDLKFSAKSMSRKKWAGVLDAPDYVAEPVGAS